jgi:type I restriction enzyme S subunit
MAEQNGFPLVPLGEVAVPIERSEEVQPDRIYRQLGVRLWGEGAYERETLAGSQTRYKALSRVEADDIIINKIWARNGSVSVVVPQLAGCYVSSEFPTFVPDNNLLEPRWFHWYTKSRACWHQCDILSRGTSGKNRIRPERFLTIKIPLPPLHEQRRIVARIEELAARIAEARGLRAQAEEEAEALCRAILLDTTDGDPILTPMRELVSLREPDIEVLPDQTYQFAGVYSFGQGVFKGESKTGLQFSYKWLTQLRTDDFVYPKLMAWEGALGVVPPECNGLFVSPEFPVFEVNQSRVLPEVLDTYFRSPSVWPLLSGVSTGTNVRRRRIHPSQFLDFKFPLPPMSTQYRLRKIRARVDAVKRLQADTAAELDALLPAVLDRAFRGAL